LERLARAMFRAWFIDFEPVKSKAAGATSFPSMPQSIFDALPTTFINSALGPIPEGWTVGKLGDIVIERRETVEPSEIELSTPYIGLEHMPRRCVTLSEWENAGTVTSGKARFNAGHILFGKLRPYFHKVGIAPVDGVCSTDIVVIEPKSEELFGLALAHASSDEFVAHTNACSTGTKMPRTNWRDMARYAIAIPSAPVASAYSDFVRPMSELMVSFIFESRHLAALRDYLLPKLLSGAVRVRDAERLAEATL
jgi:type I restriction enzyme S subunit